MFHAHIVEQKQNQMKKWINKNRRGIELAIVGLLLISREWVLATRIKNGGAREKPRGREMR